MRAGFGMPGANGQAGTAPQRHSPPVKATEEEKWLGWQAFFADADTLRPANGGKR